MLELDWDLTSFQVTLVPSAGGAFFTETSYEVATQERIAAATLIRAGLDKLYAPLQVVLTLT